MTDNELLLAISNMMDAKLEHITKDVRQIKEDVKELKIRVGNIENRIEIIENRLENLENRVTKIENRLERLENRVENLENRVESLETRVKKIELVQETQVLPQLNTIQACYTSTFDRYKDSVEDYEAMKQDLSIVKKVVEGHSKKLQRRA